MKFLTPFVLLCSIYLSAQSNCFDKTKEVYTNIIEAIGNKFPPPPTLNFSSSEKWAAFLSGNNIVVEKKLIEELCEQNNFEDKISYVIAHELAHHYLNHTWMSNTGFSHSSPIGDFVYEQGRTPEQRKLAETQADLYAGFFGQIAGYNTLAYAQETLAHVYGSYNFKKEITGYPSYDERIEIISTKKREASVLSILFEAGNAFLELKEYSLAEECYSDIIKNNFNSREIHNNLGLTYLMWAISVDDVFSKYNYPIHLDLDTRAEIKKTRSSFSIDFNSLIEKAKRYFNTAIELDPKYEKAKKNILVLEFITLKKKGIKNVVDLPRFANVNVLDKADLNVIELLIDGVKEKKIKKAAKKGSELSQSNVIKPKQVESNNNSDALKHLGIEQSKFIFGFDDAEKLKTPKGALDNLKRSLINETTVIDFGSDRYLIKTKEELTQFDINKVVIKGHTYFMVDNN